MRHLHVKINCANRFISFRNKSPRYVILPFNPPRADCINTHQITCQLYQNQLVEYIAKTSYNEFVSKLSHMPAKEKTKQNQAQDTDQRVRPEPEKELFSWSAPSRPFKKREREFWVSAVAISAIAGFILFIIEGVMPVILIIALFFLFYILSTVKPEEIQYKITNYGIKIVDKTTDMNLLTRYWFGKRFGSDLLIFEMVVFPGRLELVIHSKDKEKIKKALKEYLLFEEAAASNLDRAATYLSKKIPGNK